MQTNSIINHFQEELAYHETYAAEKTKGTSPRGQVVKYILAHINYNDKPQKPYIVHGTSGCGKTVTLAQLGRHLKAKQKNTIVIQRFIGISQRSSWLHDILIGIQIELCKELNLPVPENRIFHQVDRTLRNFDELLKEASKVLRAQKRKLVLVLDGINELHSTPGMDFVSWVPSSVPSMISLVLSTDPNEHGVLEKLLQRIPDEKTYLQVASFTEDMIVENLARWQNDVEKNLTEEQFESLFEFFAHCKTPLYVKMCFNTVIHQVPNPEGQKNSEEENPVLSNTLRAAVKDFYKRLERKYGTAMVSHVLGYMALARYGLSLKELENLLSVDDAVLREAGRLGAKSDADKLWKVLESWHGLQQELITRFQILREKLAYGTKVYSFTQRQYFQVAMECYLDGPPESPSNRSSLLRKMSDFFLWVWKQELDRFHRDEEDGHTSFESDEFSALGPEHLWNVSDLPYYLLHSEKKEDLLTITLGNFFWLFAKSKIMSLTEVINDFNITLEIMNHPEVEILRESLICVQEKLDANDKGTSHFATSLLGHIRSLSSAFPSVIGRVTKQALDWCLNRASKPLLIPTSTWLDAPIGYHIGVAGLPPRMVTAASLSKDEKRLSLAHDDKTVSIWETCDACEMLLSKVMKDPVSAISLSDSGDQAAIFSKDGLTVKILDTHHLDTDEEYVVFHQKSDTIAWETTSRWTSSKRTRLKMSANSERVLLLHENVLYVVCQGQGSAKRVTDGVSCFQISVCGQYLVTGHFKGSVSVRSMVDRKVLHTLDKHSDCVSCAFVTKEKVCATGGHDGKVVVFNLEDGKVLHEILGSKTRVQDVAIDQFGLCLGVAADSAISVWDLVSGECSYVFEQAHPDLVHTIHFASSPSDTGIPQDVLVSASREGGVKLWNLREGKVLKTLMVSCDELSVCGEAMMTRCEEEMEVRLWTLEPLQCSVERQGFLPGSGLKPVLDKEGHFACVQSRDRYFTVASDLANNTTRLLKAAGPSKDVKPLACAQVAEVHVLVSISNNRTIQLWCIEENQLIRTFDLKEEMVFSSFCPRTSQVLFSSKTGRVEVLGMSRNPEPPRHLKEVTVSGTKILHLRGDAIFYNQANVLHFSSVARPKQNIRLRSHKFHVSKVSASADISTVVSYTPKEGLFAWDTKAGKVKGKLGMEGIKVHHMDLMLDGKHVWMASGDQILIFDLSTGRQVIQQMAPGQVTSLKVVDQEVVVTTSAGNVGRFSAVNMSAARSSSFYSLGRMWWQDPPSTNSTSLTNGSVNNNQKTGSKSPRDSVGARSAEVAGEAEQMSAACVIL